MDDSILSVIAHERVNCTKHTEKTYAIRAKTKKENANQNTENNGRLPKRRKEKNLHRRHS